MFPGLVAATMPSTYSLWEASINVLYGASFNLSASSFDSMSLSAFTRSLFKAVYIYVPLCFKDSIYSVEVDKYTDMENICTDQDSGIHTLWSDLLRKKTDPVVYVDQLYNILVSKKS